jgi:hypothetical protein
MSDPVAANKNSIVATAVADVNTLDKIDSVESPNIEADAGSTYHKQRGQRSIHMSNEGALALGSTAAVAGTAALLGTTFASTGTALGSTIGSALLAPIAGLSIGVPVVAPVVVGIAILVYILIKTNRKNKELVEVMSQAVELIMRIEKCETLMSEILLKTGYISNNATLNHHLDGLMTEILKICPTSVIEKFSEFLDKGSTTSGNYNKSDQEEREISSKSINVKFRKEANTRKNKEWRYGLRSIRRYTASVFFRKHQYTRILNKLTMINAFFTTLFAEFSLTVMVLGIEIPKKGPAVQGLIDSLKLGFKLFKDKNKVLLEKKAHERYVHGRQENFLDELSKYVDPKFIEANNFEQIKSEIKDKIGEGNVITSGFKEKLGGGRHTKRRNKINKKK